MQSGMVSFMESFIYAVSLGVLGGASLHCGGHRAHSAPQALMWGVVAALAAVTAGLMLAVVVAAWRFTLVDLGAIMERLAYGLPGGALVGAVLALAAYRRTVRPELTASSEMIERRLERI